MDTGQIVLLCVSIIGAPVVAWLANRVVNLGERVAKLEARKCSCDAEQGEA